MVPLRIQMDRTENRRGAQPGRNAVLPDRGRQARGDLAYAPTARLGMDGRRCAGALDEPAANQVGVSPLLRRVATQTPDLYRVKVAL